MQAGEKRPNPPKFHYFMSFCPKIGHFPSFIARGFAKNESAFNFIENFGFPFEKAAYLNEKARLQRTGGHRFKRAVRRRTSY
jgi:hypothetical protein